METINATCPICHATHEYGSEFVGRYTFCQGCKSRFYVEVPTLAKAPQQPFPGKIDVAVKTNTTLDDLLWDTQQGSRFIMKSLQNQESQAKIQRGLIVAALALGVANLATTAWLALR